MDTLEIAREILRNTLQLNVRADQLTADTNLMGSMPEFNSLSVVGLITAVENETGCAIADDEIRSEIFETVGSFANFIKEKMP